MKGRSLLSLIPLLGLGSAPAPQGEYSVLRSFTAPRELPDVTPRPKGDKPSNTAHRGLNQRQKRLWNRRAGRIIFGAMMALSLFGMAPAQAGFYPGQWSDWDWGWPGMIPLPDTDGWWRMQDLGFYLEQFIIAIAEQWWG